MSSSDDLRRLRIEKSLPAKDMVEVIQGIFPKFDKTVLSKCEHGGEYGVSIQPEALEALYQKFDPDGEFRAEKPTRHGKHRLTCRISARLETADYEALQRRMEADGYATNQDWIAAMVAQYINGGDDRA